MSSPFPSPDWRPPEADRRRPAPGVLHVWRIAAGPTVENSVVENRQSLLSAEERERARRFRFEADRHRFLLCRSGLRLILGRYLDRPPERISFQYGPRGKPYLPRRPESAAGEVAAFNLAHAGDYGLVAIVAKGRVGVDLERVRPLDAGPVAGEFFSRAEQEEWLALPEPAKLEGFYHAWTRKEAFLKATGEGLFRPLDSFDVSLDPRAEPRIRRVEGEPGGVDRWHLLSFLPAEDYIAAVALEQKPLDVCWYELPD